MNVFMTSDTYLPDIGGAEVHVFELRKKMALLGVTTTLLVSQPRPDEEDKIWPVIRTFWRWYRIPQIFWLIFWHSRQSDIYHSHYSYKLAMVTGLVSRLRGKPFLITQHGMGLLDQPGATLIYRFAHRFYRWSSMKLATHILSTSEDLARFCLAFVSSDSITTIPNGIDTQRFHPERIEASTDSRLDGASPLLLTVRRLVPKNGIHFLISALPSIRRALPGARLVMIGDGRFREVIEKRAQQLGVSDICLFLGTVPNSLVPSIAIRADVVIFPSTAESTSIACAEMMSLGKKIVASRVGGLIELLGSNQGRGSLVSLVDWEHCNYDAPIEVPPERVEALAQAIILAYTDPKAEEKAREARRYALERLDWGVVAQKTIDVYQRMLKDTV